MVLSVLGIEGSETDSFFVWTVLISAYPVIEKFNKMLNN